MNAPASLEAEQALLGSLLIDLQCGKAQNAVKSSAMTQHTASTQKTPSCRHVNRRKAIPVVDESPKKRLRLIKGDKS